MPLDPQCQTLLDQMAAVGGPGLESLTPEEARNSYRMLMALGGSGNESVSIENRTIPGPAGEIPLRIYTPDAAAPRPVIVWFHGGGHVIGDLDTYDAVCRDLAAESSAVVVSVDYRLAPEHRYPAAVDDSYAATQWVSENAAELGGDPGRLAVAGESAGGNLAAVVPLVARDRGGPPIAFQALIYPATDLTRSHPSVEENGEGYLLTAKGMEWFNDHYLGPDGDPKDPLASPLFADDLSGLPPALVVTAEFDPLRDEGEAYAERLRDAHVPVELRRYDGQIHGFITLRTVLEAGGAALDDIARTIGKALSA